jgi:hypothetical protein
MHKSPALDCRVTEKETHRRLGEEIPWMPLGLRNKCVSVTKHTENVKNNKTIALSFGTARV